jgi:MFS family permease
VGSASGDRERSTGTVIVGLWLASGGAGGRRGNRRAGAVAAAGALRPNVLLTVAAAGFAASTVVLALVHNFAAVLVGLVFGGAAWLLCLSTLNASMRLSLPGWVRARGLSVYQLIFMGGQALGSLAWGVLAGATSSVVSPLVSAGLLAVCALSPEPTLVFEPEPLDGPVLVMTTYRVEPKDEAAFLKAIAAMGRSRQRTGAARWRLYRSVEREHTFVETFVVRSWGEHLHQHYTRLAGQDLVIERAVEQFVDNERSHTI